MAYEQTSTLNILGANETANDLAAQKGMHRLYRAVAAILWVVTTRKKKKLVIQQ